MAKVKTGPRVKRKGGGVAAKAKKVDALVEEIGRSPAIVVTEYRGLTVHQLQDLRRRLRPRGVEYHVVKNTLFLRAAEAAGRGGLRSLLVGPTAVALSGDDGKADEVELAKSVIDEMRTFKALKVVGAFVAGRALGADDVQALAKLPPRAQLRATIVGILQAPLGGLTGLLQSPLGTLVHVLAARGSAAR